MADPLEALEAIGLLPDTEIEPAIAALQLARIAAPDSAWLEASAHLSELAREAALIGGTLSDRSLEVRIGALAGLIHARFGYRGDTQTYDDPDNANLIRVIERRRGLPVALGIIWLHCIRAAGWEGWGIDFPGHFLLALAGNEPGTAATLIDAFDVGAPVSTPELLGLLRRSAGADAPLRPGMVRPMATRDVLLRLQRNLYQRRLLAGELSEAASSLEGMLRIAPDRSPTWLEAADLNCRLGRLGEAIRCLEQFLVLVPESDAARLARGKLDELRG